VQLPEKFLRSLKGINGFDKEAFERMHEPGEQVTSIRLNPAKLSIVNPSIFAQDQLSIHNSPFTIHNKVPWTEYGYYLDQRPSFTLDPFFHAGCYYVQEASSMFL